MSSLTMHCFTAKGGTALSSATAPHWLRGIYACDALEIHPVCDLNWNDAEQGPRPFNPNADNDTCCETCDEDEAYFWSVYGHLKTGGITCFADFATEAETILFAQKLYQDYWHLDR